MHSGSRGVDNGVYRRGEEGESVDSVTMWLKPWSLCCLVVCAGAIVAGGGRAEDKQDGDLEAQGSIDYPSYYHGDGYHHHHHGVSYINDAAVKALLIPLAGVALLGAAAVAASNPILLQIGVLTGKKRKRRDISRLQQIQIIESFLHQLPRAEVMDQERRLQAQYLQCSGIIDTEDQCFERITCESGRDKTNSTELQRNVLDIVTNDIMKNQFINPEFKFRLKEARKIGGSIGNCSKYLCNKIDQ